VRRRRGKDRDLAATWSERKCDIEEEQLTQESVQEIAAAERERARQKRLFDEKRIERLREGATFQRLVIVESIRFPYEVIFDVNDLRANPGVHIEPCGPTCFDFYTDGEHIGRLVVDGEQTWTLEAFTEERLETIREMVFFEDELEEVEVIRL
jgi:hypothetical protein